MRSFVLCWNFTSKPCTTRQKVCGCRLSLFLAHTFSFLNFTRRYISSMGLIPVRLFFSSSTFLHVVVNCGLVCFCISLCIVFPSCSCLFFSLMIVEIMMRLGVWLCCLFYLLIDDGRQNKASNQIKGRGKGVDVQQTERLLECNFVIQVSSYLFSVFCWMEPRSLMCID